MNQKELATICNNFEKILDISSKSNEDSRIFQLYAEYFVAFNLMKLPYITNELRKVEVKTKSSYDILLNGRTKIEVKSGRHHNRLAVASFKKGEQITESKFDYCIFVTHANLRVKEIFVFDRKELEEVALRSPKDSRATYANTNGCLLYKFDNVELYYDYFKDEKSRLNIEIELHKHPDKFLNRWNKIKPYRIIEEDLGV